MGKKELRFETISIHTGDRPEKAYGALSVPIYQTSNFAFEGIGKTKGFDYSRSANPTRKVLEDTLARLEGGKAGFAFGTGMAAETTAIHLLRAGDHVICGDDIYGGTFRLFDTIMRSFGIDFSFVRMDCRENIEQAVKPNTKMIWIETPSNPLLNIVDLEMVVDVARKHTIMTAIDNTFSSPYFLQPIEFGIDLVVHSTTKYLNGHCDVVGGAIVTATDELSQRVQFLQNAMGTCAAPFDSWLVLRGIETLAIRMRQHEKSAMTIADYLSHHPAIESVFYPGLPSNPGHDLAKRQMKGFGGMLSFELKGGFGAVEPFLRKLSIFTLAESLGGAASLAEHPPTMSHASMPEAHRKKCGICDGLVRLSIGLENAGDLIDDLEQALKAG